MKDTKWVATWGNAISITERKPENYGKNLTLRYPVLSQFDGSAVRIKLDNLCGTEPVRLAKATVGIAIGENNTEIQPITFEGYQTATILPGEWIQSDAVTLSVEKGNILFISLYFNDFTELRSGVITTGPIDNIYPKSRFAVGNYTTAEVLPMKLSKRINCTYFLSEVDILTAPENHCVICYGDSITAQDWPEYLILNNVKNGNGTTSFIRKAASGTRILRQYDDITYDSYGLKGANRFQHEMDVDGADTVIIQHGINDIIHPVGRDVNPFRPWGDLPTAEELWEGLEYYLHYANKKKMKVYLGTLLPIEGWRTYADFREQLRNDVNNRIRNQKDCVGIIDFDAALRDAQNPSAFAEGYDSGDHLHPSQKAYERMAKEIPESLYQ